LVVVPVIAIDGPAGAGKSTVARLVAKETHLPYLDTGAMYRCVALQTLKDNVDPHNQAAVARIASEITIVLEGSATFLNDVDVSNDIRTPDVAAVVSVIAALTPVRDAMRTQQREWIARHGGGVVEGRDIGTVVFPDADVKVFLTASPEERARRRVAQSGGNIDDVAAGISERDRIDSTREDSPLRPAENSVIVDSSGKSIDEVVAEIVNAFEVTRR
jgi:cytidylate kinase